MKSELVNPIWIYQYERSINETVRANFQFCYFRNPAQRGETTPFADTAGSRNTSSFCVTLTHAKIVTLTEQCDVKFLCEHCTLLQQSALLLVYAVRGGSGDGAGCERIRISHGQSIIDGVGGIVSGSLAILRGPLP
ncbi:hypothetical protein LSM04_005556 [Trypanosoma melophagium]|uniref:uncharacterized protein n=1 Tax=Trypanosoma melophagium TaxID=715481 RepID=UPI003519EED5|nr:hypothetical protein LSM04_005556 [Trypanosoma melophagium]